MTIGFLDMRKYTYNKKRYIHSKAFLKMIEEGVFTVKKSGLIINNEIDRVYHNNSEGKGYVLIDYKWKGKRRYIRAHALVWIAFNGLIPEGFEPNHKDGVKRNNRLSNIELLSHHDNIKHAVESGLICRGTDRPAAKLTEKQVIKIRKLYAAGTHSIRELQKMFKLGAHRTISKIVQGLTWAHVGGPLTMPKKLEE